MVFILLSLFFFFKQKTAYEMRISDWSSDVCSSDLQEAPHGGKITRPQVILFTMVSEFARKFQKNHHSRSNLRNCALHKMSRTSKNQEKAAVCKDMTSGEAMNYETFSHPPYAVSKAIGSESGRDRTWHNEKKSM